jgi:hypothetical protein
MRHRGGLVGGLCLGLLPIGGAVASPVVEHQPLRCVVAGMHPWLQARAPGAVAMRARFRRLEARE